MKNDSRERLIALKYNLLKNVLDERSLRLYLGAESMTLEWGGVSAVSRATGASPNTITKGRKDLENGKSLQKGKIRAPGGGRKKNIEKDPTILTDLESLIEPSTPGDPGSPLCWTSKSLRVISAELCNMGHSTSHSRVADMLHELGYSLQSNKKTNEGSQNPDRDEQFQHISNKCNLFLEKNQPVIHVDTKKKELAGNFKNNGKELRPKKDPTKVNACDFKDKEPGKVSPYGVYDINSNEGWVNVGIDHDTASFAVESIRRWWNNMGYNAYPDATRLMITADCGGSNGYYVKLWKLELQNFADETGLEISFCHFPPGTSKWNKIEHRLFSYISMNWQGKPLISYEVIVNLIASTTTQQGSKVNCVLDDNKYPERVKITKEQIEQLGIIYDEFHGEWNYTFNPKTNNY